jgi:hypothetical protein
MSPYLLGRGPPALYRFVRLDVRKTDAAVLLAIQQRANDYGIARIRLEELALLADCHTNTAYRSVRRLEASHRIRNLRGPRCNGLVIEICPPTQQS